LTGPPLPRRVDGASGKTANGNCSVPPITQVTTCSPPRTAARRALGRSETCGADAPWAWQTLEPRAAQRRQSWLSVDRRAVHRSQQLHNLGWVGRQRRRRFVDNSVVLQQLSQPYTAELTRSRCRSPGHAGYTVAAAGSWTPGCRSRA
jgi:hypothetical protein